MKMYNCRERKIFLNWIIDDSFNTTNYHHHHQAAAAVVVCEYFVAGCCVEVYLLHAVQQQQQQQQVPQCLFDRTTSHPTTIVYIHNSTSMARLPALTAPRKTVFFVFLPWFKDLIVGKKWQKLYKNQVSDYISTLR